MNMIATAGQCGGIVSVNLTANNGLGVFGGGIIQSPNYPSYYPSHHECFWKIKPPEGYSVRVIFADVDIEGTTPSSCNYDFLDVFDVDSQGTILRY